MKFLKIFRASFKLCVSASTFLLLILSFPSFSKDGPGTLPSSLNMLLNQGVHHYEQGNYVESRDIFEGMIRNGIKTGGIHYNLGHVYFRLNNLGKSIFHFRTAREHLPRDPDIQFNLNFVRQRTIDRIENEDTSFFHNVRSFFIQNIPSINLRESFYLLLISSFLLWVPSIYSLFKRMEWWKKVRPFSIGLFAFSALILLLKYSVSSSYGVIIQNEVKVYSGIGKENTVLFTLHDGAEFRPLEIANNEWVKILLIDGKKGWVKRNSVLLSQS